MIDVVVGDDHGIFVDALTAVLDQRRVPVRAVAQSAAEVVPVVRRHQPAVCLLDRSFADGDGLDLIPELRDAAAATRILMVSADADDSTARQAIEAGARGYVHKTRGIGVLIDGIHRVVAGETVLEMPPRVATRRTPESDHVHRLAAHLTPREQETLSLLVRGAGTAEIAAALGISVTTVRTHVQAVMTKLGVHTRLEAAAVAARHGLVSSA